MVKDFIPVEAKVDDNDTVWYMDISRLSLNDLVNLKNELRGSKVESIVSIDAIIHENINCNRQDLKSERRENRRSNGPYKSQKALIKRKRRGRI